jgi:hypothetical protein
LNIGVSIASEIADALGAALLENDKLLRVMKAHADEGLKLLGAPDPALDAQIKQIEATRPDLVALSKEFEAGTIDFDTYRQKLCDPPPPPQKPPTETAPPA